MVKLQEYYEDQQSKLFRWSIAIWMLLTMIMTWAGGVFSIWMADGFAKWASSPQVSSILGSEATRTFVQGIGRWLFALIAPTAIVFGLYRRSCRKADTKWWKKKYPEYDIDGEWLDTTTYTRSVTEYGWNTPAIGTSQSTVRFRQTCSKVEIQPSDGDGFMWQSIAMSWDEQDAIHILYQVTYTELLKKKGYPAGRVGYERMHVDRSGLAPKEKPSRMSGHFYHCVADDSKPMYLGDVVYERKV